MVIPKKTLGQRGARIYSPELLKNYDLLVLGFTNSVIWDSPKLRQLDTYNNNLSDHHLEIGPGTGWYLDNARFPSQIPSLTLLDLNANSLEFSANRLNRYNPTLIEADIFNPIEQCKHQFNSVAANFLLHCLPGPWSHKKVALKNIADTVSDDGVLFGTTVLGEGTKKIPPFTDPNLETHSENRLPQAAVFLTIYNALGIFGNKDDNPRNLTESLEELFHDVSVELVGATAIFEAKKPKR